MSKREWALASSVVGILGYIGVVLASPWLVTSTSQEQGGMISDMTGMMGWWAPSMSSHYSYPAFLWLIPVGFLSLLVVGIAGMMYYMFFPDVRALKASVQEKGVVGENASSASIIIKTLKPDERKVFECLLRHDGKYLQKLIRREVGLNRLQTHRAIVRMIERGLVQVEASGNTNEVKLADWLIDNSPKEIER